MVVQSRAGHRVCCLLAKRMPGHSLQEIVAFEGVEPHVRTRGDGRSTRDVVEQGDLTEEIALL